MNVHYTPKARASIRHRHRWWRANRDNARLFAEELRAALHKIRNDMDAARQRYSGQGVETVWRLLLPKTRHHVYYERDVGTDVATILTVANAIAEHGPDL